MQTRAVVVAAMIGIGATSHEASPDNQATAIVAPSLQLVRASCAEQGAEIPWNAACPLKDIIRMQSSETTSLEPARGDEKIITGDVECVETLARVLFAEADKESDEFMAAIGWVAINRLRDSTHEFKRLKTCRAVVMQSGAFSSVNGPRWQLVADTDKLNAVDRKNYERAFSIASGIWSGDIPDPTGGALLYYSPRSMNPPDSKPRTWDFSKLVEIEIEGVTGSALKLFRYR